MHKINFTIIIFIICLALYLSEQDIQQSNLAQEPRMEVSLNYIDNIHEDLYRNNVEKMAFEEWYKKYNIIYSNQEEKRYRKLVFSQQLLKIKQHNIMYELGQSSYFKGINRFTALTDLQFINIYTWKQPLDIKATTTCKGSIMDTPNPPSSLDWGNKISEVADQGSCGMDWAMVAVNSVQSLYALKIGILPTLSVQQVIECSYSYGNEGCDGGFMDQAFWYIIDNGITTNNSYPLKGNRILQPCHYVLNMKFTSFSQCAKVPSGSYSKLLSAIVQQPVSVAVNLHEDMKSYNGGIYDGNCTSIVNHGMLLTGYGGEGSSSFWKLKNTMGASFGEGGYIKIKRQAKDGDGACGVQIWPSLPQFIS